LVGQSLCELNMGEAFAVNVSSISLLMTLKRPYQRVVFPSTQSCYGSTANDLPCNETATLSPISQYAKTKVAAEKIVMEYDNVIVFRLGTLFGASPRMRTDLLINNFVYRAMRDRSVVLESPNAKRNYIHIRDAVDAFVFVIDYFEKLNNEIFNIGNSSLNISKYGICESIREHFPEFSVYLRSDIDPVDKRNYVVSLTKIESKGWRSRISLSEGITELTKAFNLINPAKYSNSC